MEHHGKNLNVQTKSGELDLVTEADKAAESCVVEALEQYFPSDGILAEEGSRREGSSGFRWIIDPLDGTTNFAHAMPHFAVSIGLTYENEVVAGVVFDPFKNEFFEAYLGRGAKLNGKPIRVSKQARLVQALCATGFSYDRRERMDDLLNRVRAILTHCQGMRRLGSAALDMAYVAAGRFDIFVEDGLNAWDVAGGHLLVKEAGGVITNFDGSPHLLESGQVVACNADLLPLVHEWLV